MNRVLTALILVTLILQCAVLYTQYNHRRQGAAPVEKVRTAPKGTSIDLSDIPVRGSDRATAILIEFADYECPYCARHANTVGGELTKRYTSSGKLKEAFVNNPLPIHPQAVNFATAAICAGEQGHYWDMHDLLFTIQPKQTEMLGGLVKNLNLDTEKFDFCMEKSGEPTNRIRKDLKTASDLGFKGTPSFVIGRINSKGKLEAQTMIIGAQPLGIFEKAIDQALSTSSP